VQTEIEYGPAYAVAKVTLAGGERVKADGGAMLAMSTGTEIETSTQGGALKGLKRSLLGGESFFMNTVTAPPQGGEILFAPKLPGDIVPFSLSGQTMYLTSGNYIASEESIDIDSHWGGAKTFFSRQGLFMLKVQGQGQVVAGSYGAIKPVELPAGESYTIDTGHLVGWEEGITYEVHKVGNWKSTFLSGEGLVAVLRGPGRFYIQTRSAEALVHWLEARLPQSNNS
jgi:uncharacterized protein (TIGR00266 family)